MRFDENYKLCRLMCRMMVKDATSSVLKGKVRSVKGSFHMTAEEG